MPFDLGNFLSSFGSGNIGGVLSNFGFGGGQQQQQQPDFPVDDFRSNSFGSNMGQFIGNTLGGYQDKAPATSNYVDFLMQGGPTREEYKPSLGRNIFGALAGAASAFGGGNPATVASQIINAPFANAMGEYQQRGNELAKAQQVEQGALGFGEKLFNDAGQLSLEGQKIKYQYDQLAQTGNIAAIEADIRRFANDTQRQQLAQQAVQNAEANRLRGQEIGVQGMNAQTNKDQNMWRMLDMLNPMGQLNHTLANTQKVFAPNAGYAEDKLQNQFLTDPRFSKFIGLDEKHQPYIAWDKMDPDTRALAQQIMQQTYSR